MQRCLYPQKTKNLLAGWSIGHAEFHRLSWGPGRVSATQKLHCPRGSPPQGARVTGGHTSPESCTPPLLCDWISVFTPESSEDHVTHLTVRSSKKIWESLFVPEGEGAEPSPEALHLPLEQLWNAAGGGSNSIFCAFLQWGAPALHHVACTHNTPGK